MSPLLFLSFRATDCDIDFHSLSETIWNSDKKFHNTHLYTRYSIFKFGDRSACNPPWLIPFAARGSVIVVRLRMPGTAMDLQGCQERFKLAFEDTKARLFEIFSVSLFGVYCKLCKKPISRSLEAVRNHLRWCHPDTSGTPDPRSVSETATPGIRMCLDGTFADGFPLPPTIG